MQIKCSQRRRLNISAKRVSFLAWNMTMNYYYAIVLTPMWPISSEEYVVGRKPLHKLLLLVWKYKLHAAKKKDFQKSVFFACFRAEFIEMNCRNSRTQLKKMVIKFCFSFFSSLSPLTSRLRVIKTRFSLSVIHCQNVEIPQINNICWQQFH